MDNQLKKVHYPLSAGKYNCTGTISSHNGYRQENEDSKD